MLASRAEDDVARFAHQKTILLASLAGRHYCSLCSPEDIYCSLCSQEESNARFARRKTIARSTCSREESNARSSRRRRVNARFARRKALLLALLAEGE